MDTEAVRQVVTALGLGPSAALVFAGWLIAREIRAGFARIEAAVVALDRLTATITTATEALAVAATRRADPREPGGH